MVETNKRELYRGDIYLADLDPAQGSEEGKTRRVLIVSNDIGNTNPKNPVVIAVPITTQATEKRKKVPMCVEIESTAENGQTYGVFDCFQIRILSIKHRLGKFIGKANEEVMQKVDRSLELCLQLKTCPSCNSVLMPNRKHCVKCKTILVDTCKGCLREVSASYKHCPHCGLERGE